MDFEKLCTMESEAGTLSHNVIQRWDCYNNEQMWGILWRGMEGLKDTYNGVMDGQYVKNNIHGPVVQVISTWKYDCIVISDGRFQRLTNSLSSYWRVNLFSFLQCFFRRLCSS